MVVGNTLVPALRDIQCCLFDAGSHVATPRDSQAQAKVSQTAFDENGERVKALEMMIDAMDAVLPLLTNFILPAGGHSSAALHHARAVCRRAERSLCLLDGVDHVRTYINRLSDFLFVAARAAAQFEGQPEATYQKSRGQTIHALTPPTPATARAPASAPGAPSRSPKPTAVSSPLTAWQVLLPSLLAGVTASALTILFYRQR